MTKLISILLFLAGMLSACDMRDLNPVYISSKIQNNYPSGSTVSYLDDKFYVMGDDAHEILVLDDNLNETERIQIFPKGEQMRLPKASKADVEASVIINRDQKPFILFLGSGSLPPYRDSAFILDPELKEVKRLDTKIFFNELRLNARELNIEAAAMVDNELLFGLRANKTYPDNYIVIADFNGSEFMFKRKIILKSSLEHAGISGMDYNGKEDLLFITFSSEDTMNSYDDGEIGESYFAIVENARYVLSKNELAINTVTKLSELSPELRNQKVESVSLTKDKRKLLLVADDDKGNTKFFTIKY